MNIRDLTKENLTVKQIADKCGISVQAVYKWEKVPLERVSAVSKLTGIPREQIRPDIFGTDQQQTQEAA